MEKPSLAAMIRQAHELGVSDHGNLTDLITTPDASNLKLAWKEFLNKNSNFQDGSFSDDEDQLLAEKVSIRELVKEALTTLRTEYPFVSAKINKIYIRKYLEGSEGTDWHCDTATGTDILVIHTLYGEAYFDAYRRDGSVRNYYCVSDSVVVIDSTVQHNASGPHNGPREIQVVPISL